MIKELENKIGQLQYEISLLGLDQEDLTGVTIRTDELKDLVKNLSLSSVSQHRELLIDFSKKIMFGEDWTPPLPYEQMVDDYLKGN